MNKTTNPTRTPHPELEHHLQCLTASLQGIAQTAKMDAAFQDVPTFFHDYMYGCWHPFEEASTATPEITEYSKTLDRTIRSMKAMIPQSEHRIFESYIEILHNRYTAELDYSYMVGFQTAFRMLLLGITSPDKIMEGYREAAKR